MMKRDKAKRKPTWKFCVLIISILIFVGLLLFTFYLYEVSFWLKSILFPAILSGIASALVALSFILKTDKERLFDVLSREIDAVIGKV